MKAISLGAIVMFLICLIPGLSGSKDSLVGQDLPNKQKRILIDASKDGGLWWFPLGSPFDAQQFHQGQAFANSLRQDGAEVVELPRGATITAERLARFDLIIRVPAYFAYSPAETVAYRDSVAAGSRLLIIGGSTKNSDRVAQVFGLDFEKRTRFSSVKRWLQHPFTANIEKGGEQIWSRVVTAPKEAVVLGWLNTANETPVLGYLPYGKGYVVFVGQALPSERSDNSFVTGLANSILSRSVEDLVMTPTTDMTVADVPIGTGPGLLEPQHNSTLAQPGGGEWRFDWEDIPDAVKYEIVILGPSATIPLIHTFTDKSEFNVGGQNPRNTDEVHRPGFIAGSNLRGWSWRVRAMFSTGTWGAWSKEGKFNIVARNN